MKTANSQPTVCAVMLTADRPELAKRAVECFRRQTYPNKRMLVLNTESDETFSIPFDTDPDDLIVWQAPELRGNTIGQLRNSANADAIERRAATDIWPTMPDILIHWDDDDWSHPARIAEQVALLESSGAEAVGYSEMLFWREPAADKCQCDAHDRAYAKTCPAVGEAWMYRGTILGTSLCYWRSTWERRKFEATSYGEDTKWLMGVKAWGAPSIVWDHPDGGPTTLPSYNVADPPKPRMVARIHGKNTSKAYDMKSLLAAPNHWTRTPHWDAYCKSVAE